MKADLTRNSFREASAYTSVRLLAGRPLLDADWNEAMEIIGRRAARTLRDVVGRVGTPVSDNGFRIDVDGEGVTTVRAGSYLVDGMRCINDADQVVAMPSGVPDGEYQVYLEAWQVLVTALEDPTIREPALLGPDHGARTKVMWRVALEAVGDQPQCAANDPAWTPQGRPHSDARLRAQAQPPTTGNDPCIVPSAAGYRSLDNQLFRVQVHHVEDLGDQTARVTWKWARDNASTAVRWTNPSITIDAPDVARLTGEFEGLQEITSLLSPGDLLELGTDSLEWDDVPGYLVRLVSVSEAELVVSSAIDPTTVGAVVLEALDVS
ncbi:MAG: DUF4815 domain-containing protein, partial [Deltaproteobacteria bacterium]|nr:DUF4815 domain-containing protein [Deltaproteobacteria bacterium]